MNDIELFPETAVEPTLHQITTGEYPTAAARSRRYREKKRADRDASVTHTVTDRDAETVTLLRRQLEIRIDYNAAGDLLLIQESWPDDDAVIIVVRENVHTFIDRLCDAVGIGQRAMSRKREDRGRLPPFIPLLKDTLASPAWRAMSHGARSALRGAKGARYSSNFKNNGKIYRAPARCRERVGFRLRGNRAAGSASCSTTASS